MDIKPFNKTGPCRTGGLKNVNINKIISVLGFGPNVADDPDKVKYSWGFTVDEVQCGIWDYKGSSDYGEFSTYGPKTIFQSLFGDEFCQ